VTAAHVLPVTESTCQQRGQQETPDTLPLLQSLYRIGDSMQRTESLRTDTGSKRQRTLHALTVT
jgi:hypothetical protein